MEISYKKPLEIELYERVGNRIKEVMSERLTINYLAQRLKDNSIFQSYNTARKFVIDMRNGYIGFLIKPNIKGDNAKTKVNLEKLAHLFSILGMDPNDDAVEIIRDTNPSFIYPLKKD